LFQFLEHFLAEGNDTIISIGIILIIGGTLLLALSIRITDGDLDRVDRRERANKIKNLLAICGMILAGLGVLLLMLNFVLSQFPALPE
jgi:uncharacterized membrane protein